MFYQWVMCAAIWMWGLLLQFVLLATDDTFDMSGNMTANESAAIFAPNAADRLLVASRSDPYSVKFFSLAALGGALWATGNTMSVTIINSIGLSMGLLIWGTANMLMGWATGRFGLFGVTKNELAHPGLNSTGVALAVVALVIYSQIKASLGTKPQLQPLQADAAGKADEEGGGSDAYASTTDDLSHSMIAPEPALEMAPPEDGPSPAQRLIGMLMAIGSGLLYGGNFTPPTYMQDHHQGPDGDHVLSYVFSHFTGIFMTSTFWFVVYCCVMKSNPRINPRLVLPGFVSGIMWAIANTCWFIANNALHGMSIAFPIITSGPGIISALWGVFVFAEIRGTRNYVMLSVSIVLSVTGCIMIALSS